MSEDDMAGFEECSILMKRNMRPFSQLIGKSEVSCLQSLLIRRGLLSWFCSEIFSSVARDDLKSVLARAASTLKVGPLLESLQITVDFELEMSKKFGLKVDSERLLQGVLRRATVWRAHSIGADCHWPSVARFYCFRTISERLCGMLRIGQFTTWSIHTSNRSHPLIPLTIGQINLLMFYLLQRNFSSFTERLWKSVLHWATDLHSLTYVASLRSGWRCTLRMFWQLVWSVSSLLCISSSKRLWHTVFATLEDLVAIQDPTSTK